MNLFICHTHFHLMVSIIKVYANPNSKYSFILCDQLNNRKNIKDALIKITNVSKVFLVEDGYTGKLLKKEEQNNFKFFNLFKRKKRVDNLFNFQINFADINNTYVFNDSSTFFLFYFDKVNSDIHLIEDGFRFYNKLHFGSLNRLLFKIFRLPSLYPDGRSNLLTSIECFHPEKLGFYRKLKSQKLSLNTLPGILSTPNNVFEKIYKLSKIFNDTDKIIDVLLITQPLSEDGIITERRKINIYRNCLKDFKGYKIFIKPHPRETTKYSSNILDVSDLSIINSNFPIELMDNYVDEIKIGITINSSSINNLMSIKKKIFI